MSFIAQTSSANEWKIIVNAISVLVEEASFEATPEGIQFRGMDPSHVAMIDLNWPNASFEKYECEKPFKLTVRVEELSKLIKRAASKNRITISSIDNEYLNIKLENGYKREFKIRLIESSYTPSPVPKLALNSKFVISKTAFVDALNDVDAIADHITIETNQDNVKFVGIGDSGQASIILEKNDNEILEINSEENNKATYSLQYLLNIVKAIGATTDTINAEYSNGMPFKLQCKLGDSGGFMNFYLAPRVDDR
jgi:proliferating cell nuclear antigen|tara:strand:- start:239 stop:997 length:759 start_codon:yes stop_codon:yes gene_type:complete